ncbi:hypothetical protein [Paenibacillus solani]|uniref:hypothetical protein n=1 Tax=Paenibacillus solani TaxID=1705565 RepID=UPI000A80C4FA|nr:hypothetical protein [Paenibacillus solani]
MHISSELTLSANYGNGQGIRAFTLSAWDESTQSWIDQGVEYTIPWTSAGEREAGETVKVNLQQPLTGSAIKINIKSANTTWGNKVVMREIAFNE